MKLFRLCVSTLLTLTLVCSLVLGPAKPVGAAEHPFRDLSGSTYEQVVSALWELGVVTGLEADKFVPAGSVTRAQMAALITRAMGKSREAEILKDTPGEFSDVATTHWASGVITLASRAGIIKGDGGRFFPNDPVNYAQAATMVVRALGYEKQVVGGYPAGYVLKANELGLLKNLNFDLMSGVNRGEAAVLLYNAIYNATTADTGNTWSQLHFRRPSALAFESLPQYVAPGQQLEVRAKATDLAGKAIPVADVVYQVVRGGSINGRQVTVGENGPVQLQARLGGLEANVTMDVVTGLSVSPETFQANKGGTMQFTATALANGQKVTVKPQWKVLQGPATVSGEGVLTVTDYGNVVVQAELGSLTAQVRGEAVGKVEITNRPQFLVPGLTYDFAAAVSDSAGKPTNVPVTWSATGATISTATGRISSIVTSGKVTVRATAGGISHEVSIPVLKSISIVPDGASVLVNNTVAFKARGIDAGGQQHAIEPRWERRNSTVGIIDAAGTFVGTSPGTTEITATVGSLVGRTQLQVSGLPARLAVSVERTNLPAGIGASTKITAKLLDLAGNLSPVNDQPISFTLGDASRGSLSKTLVLSQQGQGTVTYTAGTNAGMGVISVAVPGTTIPSSTATVTSYQTTPSYIQLAVTPQPLATGGGVASVTATLQDANGFLAAAPTTLYVTLSVSSATFGGLTGTTITIPAGQSSGSLSFISSGAAGTVQINGTSSYPVRSAALQTAVAGPVAAVKIRPITAATPVTGLSALQVQVDVLDSAGVQRANDNSTQVQLAVSGLAGVQGSPALPAATYTATAASGVAVFQVPAYAVGTATLTASLVGVENSPTDTATADFVPGVTSSLKLSVLPASPVADGFSQAQVIAEVVDVAGTVVPTINPTVTFRKLTDGGSTVAMTGLAVQAVNGKAVLPVQTTRVAGTDVWYATAPGMETQNMATVATRVSSGDAYTLRVSGTTAFTVGVPGTITVQVIDAQGQVVTSDTGRLISATHSLPGVTITPATTQNGTATFTVTGTATTSGTVTFTTTGLAVPAASTTLTFGNTGGQTGGTPYSLFASASATSVRVGSVVTLWVRVMDNQGLVVTSDNGRQVTAAVSGAASLSANSVATSGGLATFTFTGLSPGTITVTFTSPSLPQPHVTAVITVTN